jgi:hypothetical protein
MGGALSLGGFNGGFLHGTLGVFLCLLGLIKLIDFDTFVERFKGYDIVVKHEPRFAQAYPFFEIALGLLYLTATFSFIVDIAAIALMVVHTASIIQALGQGYVGHSASLGVWDDRNLDFY